MESIVRICINLTTWVRKIHEFSSLEQEWTLIELFFCYCSRVIYFVASARNILLVGNSLFNVCL